MGDEHRRITGGGMTNYDWVNEAIEATKAPLVARIAALEAERDRMRQLLAESMCARTWGHTGDGFPCSACRREAALIVGRVESGPDNTGSGHAQDS